MRENIQDGKLGVGGGAVRKIAESVGGVKGKMGNMYRGAMSSMFTRYCFSKAVPTIIFWCFRGTKVAAGRETAMSEWQAEREDMLGGEEEGVVDYFSVGDDAGSTPHNLYNVEGEWEDNPTLEKPLIDFDSEPFGMAAPRQPSAMSDLLLLDPGDFQRSFTALSMEEGGGGAAVNPVCPASLNLSRKYLSLEEFH